MPGDRRDFGAVAEGDKTLLIEQLLETVPLPLTSAPVEFVGESDGRVSHGDLRVSITIQRRPVLCVQGERAHLLPACDKYGEGAAVGQTVGGLGIFCRGCLWNNTR